MTISAVVGVGAGDGTAEGAAVGSCVGAALGGAVGAEVGKPVGSALGTAVGKAVGKAVGNAVGEALGSAVGNTVGAGDGTAEGAAVGSCVGAALGAGDGACETDGADEGAIVFVITPVAVTPFRLVVPAFAVISASSVPSLTACVMALLRLVSGSSPLAAEAPSILTVVPMETPEVCSRRRASRHDVAPKFSSLHPN